MIQFFIVSREKYIADLFFVEELVLGFVARHWFLVAAYMKFGSDPFSSEEAGSRSGNSTILLSGNSLMMYP